MPSIREVAILALMLATSFWALSFYLLLTTDSDTRIAHIDALPIVNSQSIVYIQKIQEYPSFLLYCIRIHSQSAPSRSRKALLVIGASSSEYYLKLLQQFESNSVQSVVFALKQKKFLLVTCQEYIENYLNEIGESIRLLTVEMGYQLTVLAYHEGALLSVAMLTRRPLARDFQTMLTNIKRIILINTLSPTIRIQHDPPYHFASKIQQQIASSPLRTAIFAQLNVVMISTYNYNEGPQDQYRLFPSGVVISTRDMHNLHYFVSEKRSLLFGPLLRILARFIKVEEGREMSSDQLRDFFVLGEGENHFHNAPQGRDCHKVSLQTVSNHKCLKIGRDITEALTLSQEQQDSVLMLGSLGHFQVYSSLRGYLEPYDNLTGGTMFLFEEIREHLLIVNDGLSEIRAWVAAVHSPSFPIELHEHTIEYQLQNSDIYLPIRTCQGTLLLFPLHFHVGNLRRSFLLEKSVAVCYRQEPDFMEQFFSWACERNLIIFTLLCSYYHRTTLRDRIILQFICNFIILTAIGSSSVSFRNIYVLICSTILERLLRLGISICSYLRLSNAKGLTVLSSLVALSLLSEVFSFLKVLNYWKVLVVLSVFFVNERNGVPFFLKMYFCLDEIVQNINSPASLLLLVGWLQVTRSKIPISMASLHQVFCAGLLMAVALAVPHSGAILDYLLTTYLKVFTLSYTLLRIFRAHDP